MSDEIGTLFKQASHEFAAAQNELALVLVWLFQSLRKLDKGELKSTPTLREELVQFGRWIGEVYEEAEPMTFFWTPPEDSTGWRPLIDKGSAGIAGAEKKLRTLVNVQLRSPSGPILLKLKDQLSSPKSRFDKVKAALQRMIKVANPSDDQEE